MENIVAVNGIRDILKETVEEHGWHIPQPVFEYTVRILADKVDKMPWQPEPSYAEAYLNIRTPSAALNLGNTCFFTRSVFPELLERRGLQASYFVELGQGSYTIALKHTPMPHIQALRDNFEFLAEIVYTAVRMNGSFRSMWL
jgi:hypothetical protein